MGPVSKNKALERRQLAKRRDRAARRAKQSGPAQPVSNWPDEPIGLSLDQIQRIAHVVNPTNEPILLALHLPEPWAVERRCLENSIQKALSDGGAPRWGWTFHAVQTRFGPYAWVNYHAIWMALDGRRVDVTPFVSEKKNQPAMIDGRVVFLSDMSSDPRIGPGVLGAHPQRYFALDRHPDPRLVRVLEVWQEDEYRKIEAQNARALMLASRTVGAPER